MISNAELQTILAAKLLENSLHPYFIFPTKMHFKDNI